MTKSSAQKMKSPRPRAGAEKFHPMLWLSESRKRPSTETNPPNKAARAPALDYRDQYTPPNIATAAPLK